MRFTRNVCIWPTYEIYECCLDFLVYEKILALIEYVLIVFYKWFATWNWQISELWPYQGKPDIYAENEYSLYFNQFWLNLSKIYFIFCK